MRIIEIKRHIAKLKSEEHKLKLEALNLLLKARAKNQEIIDFVTMQKGKLDKPKNPWTERPQDNGN